MSTKKAIKNIQQLETTAAIPQARFYRGNSMMGTFQPGDRLAVRPISFQQIHPGDIIIYHKPHPQEDTEEVVHRVVAVSAEGLTARGDSNPMNDRILVTADNLVGRVVSVERGGKVLPVRGGRLGLLQARSLRARRRARRYTRRWAVRLVGKPYRWLRSGGWVRAIWRPAISAVSITSDHEPVVKFIHGSKTVARLWPETGRFECRKPYDLVLWEQLNREPPEALVPRPTETPASTSASHNG